jgi:hypothetical protein
MRAMLAEGRIGKLEINKDVRVHTAWDLGLSDSTAIWFIQCVGRERRLVDYYESSGVGLDHYVDVLTEKRLQHKWTYGEHYFPHDISHREFTSGKSRKDTLAGKGDSPANVQAHNYVNPPTGGPRVRLQGGLPEEIKTADVIGASSLPWGGAREIWPRNQANMTLPQTGPQPNPIIGGHRTLPTR